MKSQLEAANPHSEVKIQGTNICLPLTVALECLNMKIAEKQNADQMKLEDDEFCEQALPIIPDTGKDPGQARNVRIILGSNNDCWYAGEWREGLRHGYGAMKYSTGEIVLGNWEDGCPVVGKTILILPNNELFVLKEGHVKSEPFAGTIPAVSPENTYEPIQDGQGTKAYKIDEIPFFYEGELKGGKPSGQGTLSSQLGVSKGQFEEGLSSGRL